MLRTGSFRVEGVVLEARPNKTYQVALANGHQLLAFVAGKARLWFQPLKPGARVNLEISVYDLSVGRIVVDTQTS